MLAPPPQPASIQLAPEVQRILNDPDSDDEDFRELPTLPNIHAAYLPSAPSPPSSSPNPALELSFAALNLRHHRQLSASPLIHNSPPSSSSPSPTVPTYPSPASDADPPPSATRVRSISNLLSRSSSASASTQSHLAGVSRKFKRVASAPWRKAAGKTDDEASPQEASESNEPETPASASILSRRPSPSTSRPTLPPSTRPLLPSRSSDPHAQPTPRAYSTLGSTTTNRIHRKAQGPQRITVAERERMEREEAEKEEERNRAEEERESEPSRNDLKDSPLPPDGPMLPSAGLGSRVPERAGVPLRAPLQGAPDGDTSTDNTAQQTRKRKVSTQDHLQQAVPKSASQRLSRDVDDDRLVSEFSQSSTAVSLRPPVPSSTRAGFQTRDRGGSLSHQVSQPPSQLWGATPISEQPQPVRLQTHRRSPTVPSSQTTSASTANKENGPNGEQGSATWVAPPTPLALAEDGVNSVDVHLKEIGNENGEVRKRAEDKASGHIREQLAPTRNAAFSSELPPAPLPHQQLGPEGVPAGKKPHYIHINRKSYHRLDCIGRGGSSRVYRVLSTDNAIYAVKKVSLDRADEETINSYVNEIALLNRLEGNDRIIRLFDSESNAKKRTLTMLMECGEIDLARLLQEKQGQPIIPHWIATYWQQMLEAVQVIHDEKIVHSDLKPANFVLVKGSLKLIDFGIAKAIPNDTTNISRDQQIGTVNYMSPEAIEDTNLMPGRRCMKLGRPSDVWSLGCILYQMIYGQPPFYTLSVLQKMKAIPDPNHVIDFPQDSVPIIPGSKDPSGAAGPPKRLTTHSTPVRKDVVEMMKSCLQRDPKKRATIPEMLAADWLNDWKTEPPSLAADEAIINPHFMEQLLNFAISYGSKNGPPDAATVKQLREEMLPALQKYSRKL
ncbi:hypothetical protein BOTBODRAFT_39650 [Botryobasidium botryosum FD-172 SS1]|uniref:Protein kinase domain-containing protein n=1 Tax=Botryobasidium botryosum (strain FD-172 SS1) TaxID=930990 RepID=A0A067LVT6_BOTB1|nr:hypothetical protein BOTBODRAFT_39650 [Botryobasidium botryosum FD-172 SS1]